jgi:GH25 family lysozyme M1 (1,4-beta-N-acetylmuramidase)
VVNLLRNLTKAAPEKLQAGVDVSSYQGKPGQWSATAGAISWAAVKITELEPNGTKYVNQYAAADWDWLASKGKGRIAYLFGHPSVSAASTVSFFISQLEAIGLKDTDGVALDLEVNDGLTASRVAAWGAEVQSELESRLGRTPLLYTFVDFAHAGNCAGLGRYPLWIADPSSARGHPRVPAPWRAWAIHQYDISGSIDLDVANYASEPEMFAALGKKSADPKEPSVQNLGGKLVTGLTTARWPDGSLIVAGLGQDGYVQATLWEGTKWTGWKNVSRTKAIGAPAVTVWIDGHGRLYYIDQAHNVIQLDTADRGKTWT